MRSQELLVILALSTVACAPSKPNVVADQLPPGTPK
jgi:hypothetical protein